MLSRRHYLVLLCALMTWGMEMPDGVSAEPTYPAQPGGWTIVDDKNNPNWLTQNDKKKWVKVQDADGSTRMVSQKNLHKYTGGPAAAEEKKAVEPTKHPQWVQVGKPTKFHRTGWDNPIEVHNGAWMKAEESLQEGHGLQDHQIAVKHKDGHYIRKSEAKRDEHGHWVSTIGDPEVVR